MFLPDVNVWLALTFDSHVHHSIRQKVVACIIDGNLLFLPNHAARIPTLGDQPDGLRRTRVTLRQAWHEYDILQSDARIAYAKEAANLETHWRQWTQNQSFSPHLERRLPCCFCRGRRYGVGHLRPSVCPIHGSASHVLAVRDRHVRPDGRWGACGWRAPGTFFSRLR